MDQENCSPTTDHQQSIYYALCVASQCFYRNEDMNTGDNKTKKEKTCRGRRKRQEETSEITMVTEAEGVETAWAQFFVPSVHLHRNIVEFSGISLSPLLTFVINTAKPKRERESLL